MPRHFPEASRGRVGRPLNPQRTCERLEAIRAAFQRRPGDIHGWTDADLNKAVSAARAVLWLFEAESQRRFDAAEAAADAAEERRLVG